MKYICNICKKTKEITKMTLTVIYNLDFPNGRTVTKEARCECGEYMEEEDKSFKGFPMAGITPEQHRVREVAYDDYYGTNKYEGYREKEQKEINKKMKKTSKKTGKLL